MNKSIAILNFMIILGGSGSLQASQDNITSTTNSTEKFVPTEKFVVMDFEDSAIHDKSWLLSQPRDTASIYVEGKKEAGDISIAIGEGRNGGNALLVESTESNNKLPAFWIKKALNAGKIKRLKNNEGYLLPRHMKANRLEFWLRFEHGFRDKKLSFSSLSNKEYRNLKVTTSHFDPSKIDGQKRVIESDGYKFTHSVFLRHDIAGDNWIHVVINQQPQSKISYNSGLPNNPTKPAGNYYELLTRLNIDLNTYFSDAEISYPVKMWVDDIALSYVPENPDFKIDFLNHSQGQTVGILINEDRAFPVKITNNSSKKACGILSTNVPWLFKPELFEHDGTDSPKSICLDGKTSRILNLTITPKSSLKLGREAYAGLTFVNENSILTDSDSINRSLTDENVEKRWRPETGSHDSIVSSDFIKLKVVSTLESTSEGSNTDSDNNSDTGNNTDSGDNSDTDNNTDSSDNSDTDNNTDSSDNSDTDNNTDSSDNSDTGSNTDSGGGSNTGTNSNTSGAGNGTATGSTANKFVIMDFEDTQVHDLNWFLSTPKGNVEFYVKGKGDSGADKISLAVGEGRNGSNALLVESTTASMGLPGFWLIKAQNNGNSSKPKDEQGYFLPRNLKANRLEFWLRFEDGFRSNKAAAFPPKWPNHQNLHVGTYQFDPARIDGVKGVVESDNWHFYHQVFLRHDKAGSGWIHVVVNQQPQHQRGISAALPNNPTMPAGNYFELLTRLYVDLHPYFSDPEKPYPVKMWVDDIALSYVPEAPDLDIKFSGHSLGDTVGISKNATSSFPVTITNNQSVEVCGILSTNTPYWFNPVLTDSNGGQINNSSLCFAANSSQNFNFSVLPKSTRKIGEISSASLTFVNENTVLSDSTSTNRSSTDGNVEKRWYPETGAHDGVVSSEFIKIKIQ